MNSLVIYDNRLRIVPLEGVHIDDTLQFMEEPIEIMEREIKQLNRSQIPLVKVRWNSRRGPEFTWEREDSFKKKYPHLFKKKDVVIYYKVLSFEDKALLMGRDCNISDFHVGDQGNVGNQNGNVVNENIQENVRNVLVNGNRIRTLSQKVVVSMSWNDFKFMMIEEFCPSHEMQKLETELWNHVMVGADHVAYTDRFHKLARNGSIKKVKKRENVREPSKDNYGRDDNKRTRIECYNRKPYRKREN
nr:putative reverse transcriptase domain-containing protein [Tanacetum cinerariifolium]